MASAIIWPISSSLPADTVATWAMVALPSTGLAMAAISATKAATAFSMPRRRLTGLVPAATFLSPSLTMAWARTVAVVVPSPARSLVLEATSCIRRAPKFSKESSSSISLAMVMPSLTICGAPYFFSSTTLRPLGPRVILTASARALTPFSRACREASSKETLFAMSCLSALQRQT